MNRHSILSISAMTVVGKVTPMRGCLAVFALFIVLCLPLVPARAAAIVDGAFVADALKRSAIVW